ncbi:hypothetical protein RN001_007066 [Aquatica leii]|uniref:Vitellogenin domain-containing protein n=1 Tax=Aquatica leii TaxID=1421715 RepID=A0AAN7P2A4_9COLE|nr:hypothetical protein RN001_007066 [Aquatica leii]
MQLILESVAVLAALSAASAFVDFIPKGKELVYSYKGEISAGTSIPKQYESQLLVYGKLYLQRQGNGLVAQLSDITYKLYNGKIYNGYIHDLQDLPLPDEAHDLLRPFRISYNSNGQFKSLTMEKDEKMFARNMHRAIAAVLQMDCKKVHFYSNDSHAFTTTEQNLYGKSVTEYDVHTKGDTLVVQKMHEMATTNPIYMQTHTNVDYDFCEARFEEPIFHDSQHKYYIKQREDVYCPEYIESTGSFRFHPYRAMSDDYAVTSKVTLDLVDMVPVTSTRSCKSEQTEYELYYRMYDTVDKDMIDLTNGRYQVDMDKQIAQAEEVLCQMGQFCMILLTKKDASVSQALSFLEYCDLPALEKLLGNLQEKSPAACEIFHQILPYVGTHASILLTKKLIYEKKVKDFEAIQMLADLPGYVRNPTEELLKNLEDMLDWGDKISEQVRRSAVLSFASLIYQSYKAQNMPTVPHDHSSDSSTEFAHIFNNINEHKQYSSFSERIKSFFKKHDVFHAYTVRFIKMIFESKDIDTQILGMQALSNTKSPYILETFVPIAKGEKDATIMLRYWAMWTVAHVTAGNSDYIYNLYWRLLVDQHEPIEIRMLAYYVLMESHPSLTRLRNIQHTLEQERDSDLYYVHYDYMTTMSQSTDPCHHVSQLNIAQVYKNAPAPTSRGFSHYYQADYIDPKYKYGEEVNYLYSGGKHYAMFKWEYNVQLANKRFNPYTIYARVEGLDKHLLHEFRVALKSTEGLFDFQRIFNFFKSVCHNKHFVLYLDRSNNKRITHSMVLRGDDLTNMDHIWDILRTLGLDFLDNRIHVQMSKRGVVPFPTEMGLPVVFETIAPSINRYHVNVKRESDDSYVMHFDNHYYFSNRIRYGLSFYNPLADTWHGVARFHNFEYQFPFFADLTINPQQGNMKLSLKKYEKDYKDTISANLIVNRQTFVKGDVSGCLQKSCHKCRSGVGNFIDDDFHTKKMVNKIDLDEYIAEYMYNSDAHWPMDIFDELKDAFSHNKKNANSLYDYLKLSYFNWYHVLFKQPPPVSTKLSVVFTPSDKCKNTQIDINARFKETVTPEEGQFLPGLKYNIRVSTSFKNKDEVLKTWDVHFTTDLNCGHTSQHTKLDIVRTIPTKKDYKISYEDKRHWSLEDLTGNSTVIYENPDTNVYDVFDVTYVGEQLSEQKTPHHGYGVCLPYVDSGVDFSSMKCLAAHSSLREYIYKIKAKNSLHPFITQVDNLANFYNCHYHTKLEENPKMSDKDMRVIMIYPTDRDGVDLIFESTHRVHTFKRVPTYLTTTSNTHTSKLYSFLFEKNLMQKCHADIYKVQQDEFQDKPVDCELSDSWTLYIGNAETDCKHGVFLKRITGTKLMAFKIFHDDHSVEIYPYGNNYEKFKLIVDETEVVQETDFYSCDWLTCLYRENDHEVREGSGLVAQLSDISYKLYNGKIYNGYKHDLQDLPIADEAKDLLRPFKISYNSNGQLKSLSMEKDEKMFARNMHRAIAAVLQMDCKKVNFYSNHTHAFTTTEQNLYGKSVTEYDVHTKGDTLVVQKMHEMATTNPIYMQTHSNIDFDFCEARFEEPVFHDSQHKYVIRKKEDIYCADYIESTGSIRMHLYRAMSDDYSVTSKVTLDLVDTVLITNSRSRKSEQTEYQIHYRMYNTADKDMIDLTNGRYLVDMGKQIAQAEEVLCQMGEFLHDPLNEKDASVNHAISLLRYFDLPSLEKLLSNLQNKSPAACEIFHQILPYAGTHASILLAKKLIYEKKVKDFEAIQILADLPGYVRNPTEELLKNLEDMLEWDDKINEQVRRSAVLSFASLIYQAYKVQNMPTVSYDHSSDASNEFAHIYNNINGHKQYNSFSERIKSFFKKHDNFHTYTVKFVKMIYEGEDVATQILGMQALFNTKSPFIVETFVPIAKGEKHASIMMRVWAMWMIAHVTVGKSDYIYNLYWPLLVDQNEPVEIRVVAYYVLMESHPSLTRLRNIQHTLEQERHSDLYYVHYNYMTTMSQSTDPCHYVSQLNIAQVFKNAPAPTSRGFSHYYQADYIDQKYKYGEEVNYIYTGGKHSGMFKWEYNVQLANRRYNPYTIYARVEGDDLTNMDRIWEVLRTFGFSFVDNRIHVHMIKSIIVPFPTEIGLPVVLETIEPSINRYHVNVQRETNGNYVMHFDNHYYFSHLIGYGLTFYNALSDTWHGVSRFHSLRYQFPFFADLTLNPSQGNMKLSLKKYEKDYKDTIAANLMINRHTYIKGDVSGCLQKSCQKCQSLVGNFIDDEFHTTKIKNKMDLDEYIAEYEYNTDSYWPMSVFDELKHAFSHNKKNINSLWDYLKLSYFNWYHVLFKQPPPVSTKLSVAFTPSDKCKNTQIDINARLKYDFRISASSKNKGEVLKTWDMHFTTDLNCGHTYQHTKVDVVHKRQWSLEDLTGNSTVIIENPDNKVYDVFDITYVGTQLSEQKTPHHGYGVCLPFMDSGVDFSSMKCLAAHSSLREYIYKIKAKNSLQTFITQVDNLANFYNCHYQTNFVTNPKMSDKDMKVTMIYPTNTRGVDLAYESKHRVQNFKGIPTYLTKTSNTHTSSLYSFLFEKNLMQKCRANIYKVHQDQFHDKPVDCALSDSWTLYIGDTEGDCKHGVFLKRLTNTKLMAVKILHSDRSVEIYPCGDNYEKFKFVVDGTEIVQKKDFYSCDWLTYLYRENDHEVIINALHFHLMMRYTGQSIDIDIPMVDGISFYGKCFM